MQFCQIRQVWNTFEAFKKGRARNTRDIEVHKRLVVSELKQCIKQGFTWGMWDGLDAGGFNSWAAPVPRL